MMELEGRLQTAINSCYQKGDRPVLIFDLDDTLIDCRHRKLKVFFDFLERASHRQRFPKECERLARMGLSEVKFRVSECLEEIKIANPEFEKELHSFWLKHYFTYPYLLNDQAFPNAERYVEDWLGADLDIVYLTGRDEPGMGQGTRERLQSLRFPYPHKNAHLILKPDPLQSDLGFKQEALKAVDRIGTTVAIFENEVRNLNMMGSYYQNALLILRQTLQSPGQPDPHPSIIPHHSF